MKKYVCIHGHFYQPPRENPWLESIEMQDSAYPYHDWNERITIECYAPNSASRILNEEGLIVKIVNNYKNISFNFGPTLLSWFKSNKPELLTLIQKADLESQDIFHSHGSAIAQAYNHMILPLANSRDKYTQIIWGIKDFEFYFRRKPEGFWLPETAVDLESLDIMAELGIKFTILAPHQAKRIKKINEEQWHDFDTDKIDIFMPYLQKLPSGRSIAIFFYDGPTSQALAFENLLKSGHDLASRLVGSFHDSSSQAQLEHIATDGETYGHHHSHGDMALAYALREIREKKNVEIIVYGYFLEMYPPIYEVDIHENTSWSCMHGIERWKNDCGCQSGQHTNWNQKWRAPLRESFDWLRDALIPLYEEIIAKYLKDPWSARNDYIEIIHDRSPNILDEFFKKHSTRQLTDLEIQESLKALELQRHTLLMYTSCGWFFDELSGMETVQVVEYAARAIQLAEALSKVDYLSPFLTLLSKATSNISDLENGRKIFELYVQPSQVSLVDVAAHYAMSSLFNKYESQTNIFCYKVMSNTENFMESGKVKMKFGSIKVISEITHESIVANYAVIHFGDQNLNCSAREFVSDKFFNEMSVDLTDCFQSGNFLDILKVFDKYFGASQYSLKNLFGDEQRKIIKLILKSTLEEADGIFKAFYENHASIVNFLSDISKPLPKLLQMTIEYVLNSDFEKYIEEDFPDIDKIKTLINTAKRVNVKLDLQRIEFILGEKIYQLVMDINDNPNDIDFIKYLINFFDFINKNNLNVYIWRVQNILYDLVKNNKIIYEKSNEIFYENLFHQLKIKIK